MDRNMLVKASKDVRAIKEIIERTTEDFMQLGKIFIGWGLAFFVLFIGTMTAYVFKNELSEIIASFPVIIVIPLILAGGIASISYYMIKRMKGLNGLTKPLLAVWLAIVIYITVFPAFGYIVRIDGIIKNYRGYYIGNYIIFIHSTVDIFFQSYMGISYLLFTFIFGLLCLRLFTRLKFAGVLALIYILLFGAYYALLFITGPGYSGEFYRTFSIISFSVIVPATFLIVGGYLEHYRARRS